MFTTSSWTRLKSIQSSLVLFSACFDLLLYVYTIWKSADQLLFLYDQRRRLSLNEGEYLWKIPYSSKIDPRDFRTEILLIPLRIARYFWFCAGVNSKTLLNSGGLKNLPTSESRYTLNSTSPRQKTSWNTLFIQFLKKLFYLSNTPLFIFKMNELEYQFFLFTVPAIMTLILIVIAVKIYRKCKDSKYMAFPVPGETDDI